MKKRILSITLVIVLILALAPMTAAAAPRTAEPTPSAVYVNGERVELRAYLIGGYNFFKLRSLAYALNGTDAQFSVDWNEATNIITLTSGQPYVAVGGETALGPGTQQTATPTTSMVVLDKDVLNLRAYLIGGNNFFRLRDVMRAIDVAVIWDEQANTISLDTSYGYRDDALVGRWVWDYDSSFVTTFYYDGTGTHAISWGWGDTFYWDTIFDYLLWLYPGYEEMYTEYHIDGDALYIVMGDGTVFRYLRD